MSSTTPDPKIKPRPKQKKGSPDVNVWIEKYIQAHLDGNKTMKKIYGDIIIKLNGKIPKL
jgi:hypothetical protein